MKFTGQCGSLIHSFPFLYSPLRCPVLSPDGYQEMVQNSTLFIYSLHLRMGETDIYVINTYTALFQPVLHHLILLTTSFTFAFLR